MAVNGIGNGYFYPVKNQETVGMKASDSKPSSRTVVNNGGVSYEKSISDAASSGLDFIQEVEKRNSGTKFFVGTVGYGQTYGNSSDVNFVIHPKYLDKLGTDEEARMTFEKDVKFLTNCSKQFKAQMKAQGREVVSDGWFCDENGNWGGWVITKNSDKSSFLKKMSDHTNEILEKKLAKKKGKATITATVSYRGKKKKLKCRVTVLQGAKKLRIVDEDKKNVNSIVLNKFDSVKLTGVVSPKKSNDKVMWKSYNPEVATVTSKGVVTGQYVGKTTVRAKTYSGKRVKVKVTVKAPVLSDTLKTAYIKDFKIGAAVNTWQLEGAGAYAKAKALITNQFNSITMENQMKPESLLSKENQTRGTDTNVLINEEILQKVLKLASDNGLKLRGHTLVWHSQTPEWFFHKDYNVDKSLVSKDVMRQRMESYIKKVLTYCQENYPGVVYAWDVVNEAVNDDGTMRTSSNWYKVYGDAGYVTDAFTFARKYADKDVKLFLNDYNEYAAAKRDRIYQVVKDLYDKGLCDGVGMQSHYSMTSPTIAAVKVAIQKYNQIDPGKIEIQLTELDIHNTFRTAADQKSVATKYQSLFNMLVDSRRNQKINITGVTFWGLTDGDSWLSDFKGETSYPLLFGADYAAKSAYFAVLNAAK